MRSRQLQTALTEFVAEAALSLQADVAAGGEVPIELTARPARGRRAPFYSYRPLSADFIAGRWSTLRGLPSHARATSVLVDFEGLDRYLLARDAQSRRGERHGRASLALRELLCEVFAEQTDFEVREERLAQALERFEDSGELHVERVTLLGTLHGLTLQSQQLALTRGLTLARPEALTGVPDAALALADAPDADAGRAGHLLVVLSAEDPDPRRALRDGREVLYELLRALRLFGDGRVTLGAQAWGRVGSGPWSAIALGVGGRPHGMLVIGVEQEDELRAFCNLVSRRAPHGDEIAWALRRFELGCERVEEYEALSDYLLALRALLEPDGSASGQLPGRLAALCATPQHRPRLTERVVRAIALERAVLAGTAREHARGSKLVREISGHLRALLRDVLCGHLERDLVGLADAILLGEDEAGERELAVAAAIEGVDDDPWETDQLQLAGLPG